ncbi:PhoPQ-activated protein PqaA family protein [Planctomycetota bacterium]
MLRRNLTAFARMGIVAVVVWLSLSACAGAQEAPEAEPFDFEAASKDVPKPREIWPLVREHTAPLEFEIRSDEIVRSDTDPAKKLRKVTAHFYSQELAGKKWGHPCVIFLPEDADRNLTPERKGKVVIIGSPPRDYFPIHVDKYGEPIATRTGYPTMVLSNPGRYPDGSDIERDIRILNTLRQQTGKNYYNMNCQLAVVYIQAMDAFEQFLGLDDLKAVVGGHSKRGRSATVAAAIDPRVASVIVMGNEGIYATDRLQFMDFMMWVAHVFDGRPLSRISEVSHQRQQGRTVFQAKVESEAKIQMVRTWYTYSDDPAWRDLMWYHLLMRKVGDHYEAALHGKIPDAFMIEVGDVAMGFSGYVSSTPQKLTDAPLVERRSRGSLPRLWEPGD